MADGVAEHRVGPLLDRPGHRFGVGIDQQLVGVEAVALAGTVGPVHAVAVELARADVGQVTVPDEVGSLAQRDALRFEGIVRLLEQAEVHGLGVLGEDREVHALAVPRGPLRIGVPRPHPHLPLHLPPVALAREQDE